jgi:cytochrome c-type biogenesis protein CcmE|tara:strand:+ start:183 stop:611 length:429 start_codon:yes stop_codon:yes gene_type:complete
MLTKKVKKRIYFLTIFLSILLVAIFFILKTLNNNLLYFRSPTDITLNSNIKIDTPMRLGGMVKTGSILTKKDEINFIITDFKNEIIVSFSGSAPNLFAEEKGVIAEGKLRDKKFFIADRILAKHDENYMPPALKEVLDNNVK